MGRLLGNRKLLAGAFLVALLLAVALWPKRVEVDVARVARGPLQVTVDEEGETRVHDKFVIAAPVAGRVLRIDLEPGDRVAAGQTVLATFRPGDPTPLDARSRAEAEASVRASESALGRARAERERARAASELAHREAARTRDLFAAQVASKELLDARESEARAAAEALQAAEFAVAGAEHELAMVRARLLQATPGGTAGAVLTIRSPIDGVVLRRLRQSETVVPAGDPLLELGDPRRLEIVADFLSSDAVRIHPGDPVHIERWGDERVLRGKVRLVEPSGFTKISALGVEEQRVNVIIDFVDPAEAWSRLGDAYRVEVRVVVWERPEVTVVPTSALFRRGDAWAVFAVEGGRARLRTVTLGQRNGLAAEVKEGLAPGDAVVVHPSDAVADGTRVAGRAADAVSR